MRREGGEKSGREEEREGREEREGERRAGEVRVEVEEQQQL